MTFLERFLAPGPAHAPAFVVLFANTPPTDAGALTADLRRTHAETAEGTFELQPGESDGEETVRGLAEWGPHAVQLLGYAGRVPDDVLDRCVHPAPLRPELKRLAIDHQSHAVIAYKGTATDPFEQHVALALAAGVLTAAGATFVLNEAGRSAFPTAGLRTDGEGLDALVFLRDLPPLMLYAGFAALEIANLRGVWMRTRGCPALGLPDLAFRASTHEQGEEVFDLFTEILGYLQRSGKRLGVGHTMQMGADLFLTLRAPTELEWFLDSPGEMFVAEITNPDEAFQR